MRICSVSSDLFRFDTRHSWQAGSKLSLHAGVGVCTYSAVVTGPNLRWVRGTSRSYSVKEARPLVAAVSNHETRYANCNQSQQLVLYNSWLLQFFSRQLFYLYFLLFLHQSYPFSFFFLIYNFSLLRFALILVSTSHRQTRVLRVTARVGLVWIRCMLLLCIGVERIYFP